MKKLLFAILAMTLVLTSTYAQDAGKSFKKAKKAMKSYLLENGQNDAKLQEVVDGLALAASDSEINSSYDFLKLKGDVNVEISKKFSILKNSSLEIPTNFPKTDAPGINALDAYRKGYDVARKKYQKKKMLTGIYNAQLELNNQGYFAYQDQDFETAYLNFVAILDAHEILAKYDKESTLKGAKQISDLKYTVGVTAKASNHNDVALKIYKELAEESYDNAGIYDGLFNILSETDMEAAYNYLTIGREKFPNETSLLFAEINYYLKKGELNKLIGKLELAIEKEPNNPSIFSTLGNVYDQLYQKEAEAKNNDKATEFFDKALMQFESALKIDESYFDAIYSIGALYYNRAAAITVEMNEITGWDKASVAKSKEFKAKADKQFAAAMPYFERAEKLNPNDMNTLIALKEISARNNDFDKSNEYKARLEAIRAKAGQ